MTAGAETPPIAGPPDTEGPAAPWAALRAEVREQASCLAGLKRSLAECRDELGALAACLSKRNVVTATQLNAQLHRRRFQEARRLHGLELEATLNEVVGPSELALVIGTLAGPASLQEACSASRPCAEALGPVLRTVRSRSGCHLVLCGGGRDLDSPIRSAEQFMSVRGGWEALPPLTEARWLHGAGVLRGVVFVCGGGSGNEALRTVECFDPAVGAWRAVAPMLVPRYGLAAVVNDDCIYACGGETTQGDQSITLNSVESYDPVVGHWSPQPFMFERRAWFGGASLCGVIYVCGGADEFNNPLSTVERLDTLVGFWGSAPTMSVPREGAAVAAWGSRLWACGGKGQREQRWSTVECLEEGSASWETLAAPMASARNNAAAAAVGGRCYVFGGYDGESVLSTAEVFDPTRAEWSAMAPMGSARWASCAVDLMRH